MLAYAKKADFKVVGVWKETASGTKQNRAERQKVMALAQARQIDAILVTELTRWGRSTLDLIQTLQDLPELGCLVDSSDRASVRFGDASRSVDCSTHGSAGRV